MQKKVTSPSRFAAFTLIELLVVIAMIAILAAILFPVFAKAREKARQTVCASNEKQLCLGILQYVQDFDERFPQIWEGAETSDNWPKRVYPYVKSTQVFSCPDDPGKNNIADSLRGVAGNYYDRESYGMNIGLGESDASHGLSIAAVNSPAETCLIAETFLKTSPGLAFGWFHPDYMSSHIDEGENTGYPKLWYSGADTPTPLDSPKVAVDFSTPYTCHTGGADIGFTDGHVKWLRYDAIYSLPTGMTDKTKFKLWHPDAPDT